MSEPAGVAAITVSYSGRMDHLRRQGEVLAREPGLREWIVVTNGNCALVRATLPALPLAPRLVEHVRNEGSATGFGAGIVAALDDPANRYVLLLDEDNLPAAGTVVQLLATLAEARQSGEAPGGLAVACYRERVHWAQAHGIEPRRADSCIGFHVADLPAKLLRRLWPAPPPAGRIPLRTAAYGGLLLERSLLQSAGLPLPQLVLYGDDTEFTLRLTTGGATIILDTGLAMTDMGNPAARRTTLFSFPGWLSIADDFRLYYGARNESWLDRHRFARHLLVYRFNRAIVRAVLRCYARTTEERRRLGIFTEAAADGEAGQLGRNPRYPLPEAQT